MPAEGKPAFHPLAQHLSWHSQNPHGRGGAAGCQIDALIVPCAESASPAPGGVHLRDDGLLATYVAPEIYDTVEEHPPEIGMLTLPEELSTGLSADFFAAL